MSIEDKTIDDLIYESGIIAQGCFDKYDVDALKKFAELIVRECANVAAARDALDIYEEIREHFGVKE